MKNTDQSGIETNFKVRTLDATISPEDYRKLPKHPLYVILDNLRSAFNVGAIFRLCDVMRVAGLFLCGYTASPPHAKLQKTSMGTVDYVPWKKFNSTREAIFSLKEQGIPVWAAETASASKRYDEAVVPSALGVVFGNEALGIGSDILEICDLCVEIPVYGFKNSLNVATSCAVIGYSVIKAMERKKAP
jgi:tRNA G18 (ribose-2'-O)-methylase SpoU